MTKLSSKQRNALPSKDFAFPKSRSYPIEDAGHRKAALMDAPASKKGAIRRAIARKGK